MEHQALQDDQIRDKLHLLQKRIRTCRLCQELGYIKQAHAIVSGYADNRILLIGQAPGHRSIENDLPFSGPGGRILQRWLEIAGFPSDYLHKHIYLSSLTRCDPGKNPRASGDRRPSPAEVALCQPYLEAELHLLRPLVVILVGRMAIETYFKPPEKSRLEDLIGTYKQEQETFLLPLPHPSGVSRWLNDPTHQALLRQALAILEHWRITYNL